MRAAASPYAFTADPANAMEVLQEENKLLKNTIADAKVAIADLELQLRAAGVAIPAPEPMPDPTPATPEDYWTPTLEVRLCVRAAHGLTCGYGSAAAMAHMAQPFGEPLPCATSGVATAPSCAYTANFLTMLREQPAMERSAPLRTASRL